MGITCIPTYGHFTQTSTQYGTTFSSLKSHPQSRKTTPSHYPTQKSNKPSAGLPTTLTSGVSSGKASFKNGLTKSQVGCPAQTRSNGLPLTLKLRWVWGERPASKFYQITTCCVLTTGPDRPTTSSATVFGQRRSMNRLINEPYASLLFLTGIPSLNITKQLGRQPTPTITGT